MALLAALVAAGLPFFVETRELDLVRASRGAVGRDSVAPEQVGRLRPTPACEAVLTFPPANQGSAPFRELLASWNVDAPEGTGFVVEVRVLGEPAGWSPWMHLGDWGSVPAAERVTRCDGGKVDVDVFRGERTFASAELRVRGFTREPERELRVRRMTLCLADRERAVPAREPPEPRPWGRVLDVPLRSQKTEKREIAGRICSPTSLAMLLAYRGVDVPTQAVAERAFDPLHDLYGVWPRNVQAAWSFGVPGYLTRFCDWAEVERSIAAGQPLIVTIGAQKGQLANAPYESTAGHLIVLCGFDERGACVVNDPAAADPKEARRVYARADLETVWMQRGGVCYVLLPRP